MIRVRLNSDDQLWRLYQTLRDQCEVEMVSDSEVAVLEIRAIPAPAAPPCSAGSMVVGEFGLESISL